MFWQRACDLRVAVPAVVTAFHAGPPQTVDVQPAVQESIYEDLKPTPTNLPLLPNIPVLIPVAGGFAVTFPITSGDECLVVFCDMCINLWRLNGAPTTGSVALQEETRRHDLSDGVAVFGLTSKPRGIASYSTANMQIRSLNGNVKIDMSSSQILMTPDNGTTSVVIKANEIDLNATTININGHPFSGHEHTSVQTGSGNTGGVKSGT
jgi:hypothetical protein